jgi:penicillin-binding protein 2
MSRRIGIDKMAEMARLMTLGKKYELPVVSQSYGTYPDRAWKQSKYKDRWRESDTLNAAIGQGYVILNPLQLAVMAARIASGRPVEPQLDPREAAGRRPRWVCPSSTSRLRAQACGKWSMVTARPGAVVSRSKESKWVERPAPRRSGASPAGSAASPASGNIGTTACSSSSRRPATRVTRARW